MDIIYNRLFELIGDKHGSAKELATALGISPNNITNWKAKRSDAYTKYLPKIAEYYGVSLDWLSGRSEQKETALTSNGKSGDPDIRRIERAKSRMTEKEWCHQMEVIQASFGDYFSDNYKDEDSDE